MKYIALATCLALLAGCPEPRDAVIDDQDDDDGDEVVDSDSDGVPADEDCDDEDPDAFPGNPEICDGIDNDCDGDVPLDEADADHDGQAACEGDCDDDDADNWLGNTEQCDGADNDCDGLLGPDEIDDDLDGVTECDGDCDDAAADIAPGAPEDWYDGVDSDCDGDDDPDACDDPPPVTSVPVLGTCSYTPEPGEFAPEVEWQMDVFATYPSYTQLMAQPVVANVTDDNGDGLVNDDDIPDILFCAFGGGGYGGPGVLRVLSGDGSGEHWSLQDVGSSQIFGAGSISVGDIDGDGFPEIVTMDTGGRPVAISHDGVYEWTGNDAGGQSGSTPAIADLDQDGTAEIVVGARIFSHLGEVEGEGAYGIGSNYSAYWYTSSAIADVTGDGFLEVVAGNAIYDATGAAIWHNGLADGNPAVANFDADDAGEIVVVSSGGVRLQDDDGSVIWGPVGLVGAGGGGTPTIADYDGDGEPEIGVSGAGTYDVLDTDGSLLWSNPIVDASSSRTGSSVFDFDGDGMSEVVYADEHTLWIFAGLDGAVLHAETNHASGTLAEYPVIADVDADGNAEIVLASNNYAFSGWTGITVIGDGGDNWVSARPIWNQHAYHISNVQDDGTIPVVEPPNWPDFNSFRQGGFGTLDPLDAPDAALEPMDHCLRTCPHEFTWMLRPFNQGVADLPAGIAIAIYAEDPAGERVLLQNQHTIAPMPSGQTATTLEVTLVSADLVGAARIVAVIDDLGDGAGEVNECDEENNEAELVLPVCP